MINKAERYEFTLYRTVQPISTVGKLNFMKKKPKTDFLRHASD